MFVSDFWNPDIEPEIRNMKLETLHEIRFTNAQAPACQEPVDFPGV